jgi:hypothetical protein
MYDQKKIEEFVSWSEEISKTLDKNEAFKIITAEIDNCENRYLHEYITALNFIRYEKVLDWIELNSHRIINVTLNWGHLAASSQFNWAKADDWLSKGRPLSLIALDALMFCTTNGERLNQSPWMREIQPRLIDNPKPEIVARRLKEYLTVDKVPRTDAVVEQIIKNIFEIF